jgi:hypothetical protein
MKKVTIEQEVNKLQIEYDEDADNPREWNNIGIFLSKSLPDDRTVNYLDRPSNAVSCELAWEVIMNTEVVDSVSQHAQDIAKELGDVIVIPVYKYEHSGVEVFIENGTMCRFDTGVTGFYIVSKTDMADENLSLEDVYKIVSGELETYTKWCNGEVYRYTLLDDKGEVSDSCGGFYSLDEIKADLVSIDDEWENEDMDNYLTY